MLIIQTELQQLYTNFDTEYQTNQYAYSSSIQLEVVYVVLKNPVQFSQ